MITTSSSEEKQIMRYTFRKRGHLKFAEIPRIAPAAAFEAVRTGAARLVDVRSPSARAREAVAIPGSLRADPRQLGEPEVPLLPNDRPLILYCG